MIDLVVAEVVIDVAIVKDQDPIEVATEFVANRDPLDIIVINEYPDDNDAA